MKQIKGLIKEDAKAAFELICDRHEVDPSEAKGVGYLNRLIKLCSVCKLVIELDYITDHFLVSGVKELPTDITSTGEKEMDPWDN
jgi:hypothetical protein